MSDGATFDPQVDIMTINAIPIQGRASGTSITWALTRREYTMDVGIDGLGYYTRVRDLSATVTIVLQPNAPENDLLNAFLLADRNTPNGLLFPATLTRGRTVLAGLGKIDGSPALDWSDGSMPTTWTFMSTRWTGVVGGKLASEVAA